MTRDELLQLREDLITTASTKPKTNIKVDVVDGEHKGQSGVVEVVEIRQPSSTPRFPDGAVVILNGGRGRVFIAVGALQRTQGTN